MIKLSNVTKKYSDGKDIIALKNVNLQIADGESVAILGKSGAGKSTLLHIIGGIDTFDSGEFYVDAQNIKHLTERELARFRNEDVGFVMQDFALIANQTALYNVMLPLYFDKTPRKKMREIALSALRKMELDEKANILVNHLSGGEKQRVAIARAIVKQPKIILADEPTGALDSDTSIKIVKMLMNLNKTGTTVLIVTHDKDVAEFCNRIITLLDGTIQTDSKFT